MTKRATVDDFPIGCTVKIVGPIPEEKQWYLDAYVDEIGMVMSHGSDGRVVVGFGPSTDEPNGILADLAWLERGRVEWIPETRTIEDDPVLYAIAIIESYQADLRNTRIHGDAQLQIDGGELDIVGGGQTLAEAGLCQGRIYRNAISRIKRLAGIQDEEVTA